MFFFSFLRARGAAFAMLFGHLLFAGNGPRRTLSGTGVCVRPLATNRKSAAVSQAAIAAQIHQAFYIHCDFTPQIALDDIIVINGFTDLDHFRFGQIANATIFTDTDLLADIPGIGRTNTVDVAQCDFHSLVCRNVNPGDAGHGILLFDERRTRDHVARIP
jgi:hypothetical protein